MNQNMNWFMIPVKIFERAVDFYSVLFDQKISKDEDHKWYEIGLIRLNEKILWCITSNDSYVPSLDWVVVYMDVWDKIDTILNNVIPAGWKIKMPKTTIWNYWYIAQFEDSEGNLLWLFKNKE